MLCSIHTVVLYYNYTIVFSLHYRISQDRRFDGCVVWDGGSYCTSQYMEGEKLISEREREICMPKYVIMFSITYYLSHDKYLMHIEHWTYKLHVQHNIYRPWLWCFYCTVLYGIDPLLLLLIGPCIHLYGTIVILLYLKLPLTPYKMQYQRKQKMWFSHSFNFLPVDQLATTKTTSKKIITLLY